MLQNILIASSIFFVSNLAIAQVPGSIPLRSRETTALPAQTVQGFFGGLAGDINGAIKQINQAASNAKTPARRQSQADGPLLHLKAEESGFIRPGKDIQSSPALANQSVDLSAMLKGYQTGCNLTSEDGNKFLQWLIADDEKGTLKAKPALTPALDAAIGTPTKSDEGDHWMYSIPMKKTTFKGLNVERIDRYIGKNNGINGFQIFFAEPLKKVKMVFKNEQFKEDEMGSRPFLGADRGKPVLSCDTSN